MTGGAPWSTVIRLAQMIEKYESQFRKLRPNAKRLIGGFRDDMGRDLIQIVAPFWSLLGNLLLFQGSQNES